MRWLFTILIMIKLKDYPNLQILILLSLSYIVQGLLTTIHPFESKLDNIMAILNEVSVSIYLYIMMLISDSNGETTSTQREFFGWALTILMCAVVFINFIKTLIILVKKVLTFIRIKVSKYCE